MSLLERYKVTLTKPDGRHLTLYSRRPLDGNLVAPAPNVEGAGGESHLRWHPLRGEWVAYASHRQGRTFLPPKEYNPLAPSRPNAPPTELPAGDYDIAVFDNLFASLRLDATSAPELTVPSRPGEGHCEVVVFTQEAESSLGQLPLAHIQLLIEVWADRYQELGRKSQLKYILPFENRGVEVGVTLHHPHGQIYAYPFVPPLQVEMEKTQKAHWQEHGETLVGHLLAEERKGGQRMVVQGEHTSAFVPVCARYPYEVWIVPHRAVSFLHQMSASEMADLARTLKLTLLKFDGLWQRPFPYLMALYAAPWDGEGHEEWHFHIQFYPPYRSRDRLKYLAGTELAAGMFVNDSLPEAKAAELRQVEVRLD